MTRAADGWWRPTGRATARRRRATATSRRRAHAAARPAVAAPARRRPRAVARLRSGHVRVDRPGLDRAPARRRLIYELHIGTFTPDGHARRGDREAATTSVDLGVDHVELLPVNAFNGAQNWGYDGVGWFAVHETTAARRRTSGSSTPATPRARRDPGRRLQPPRPSGNYLPQFGPYLKSGANTWGDLGQPRRRGVRRGAPLHPRQRADVAARTTTSTGCASMPCTRSSTTPPSSARGDGDRGRRALGAPAAAR